MGSMDRWRCERVVERTTDYIEDSLSAADLAQMAAHLDGCAGCETYLGEVRVTLQLLSGLPSEVVSDQLELSLLARYRERAASVSL